MWNGWDLHGSNGEMTIRWKVFRYFAILPTFRKMCLCSISIPNESLKLYTREWAKREKNTALTCDAFVIFMPNWNLLHTSKSIYDFWSWPWKKVTLTKNKTKARIWKTHTQISDMHMTWAHLCLSVTIRMEYHKIWMRRGWEKGSTSAIINIFDIWNEWILDIISIFWRITQMDDLPKWKIAEGSWHINSIGEYQYFINTTSDEIIHSHLIWNLIY